MASLSLIDTSILAHLDPCAFYIFRVEILWWWNCEHFIILCEFLLFHQPDIITKQKGNLTWQIVIYRNPFVHTSSHIGLREGSGSEIQICVFAFFGKQSNFARRRIQGASSNRSGWKMGYLQRSQLGWILMWFSHIQIHQKQTSVYSSDSINSICILCCKKVS